MAVTAEQFAEYFLKDFDYRVTKNYRGNANGCDRILCITFDKYRKDVKEHLINCFPTDTNKFNAENSVAHYIGPQFHKGFRAWGVIDVPMIDSVVWLAIGDSNVFWDCFNRVCEYVDKGVNIDADDLF